MRIEIVLTVSESKRLIAKGVRELEIVKEAMKRGIVALAKGTTNTYVASEFLQEPVEPFSYSMGITLPRGAHPGRQVESRPDLVFVNGELTQEMSAIEATHQMGPGDVFIKGANALNYEKGVAGLLVGDPTGGTIGKSIGYVVGRKAHLVVPVGLEKCIPFDILDLHRQIVNRWTEDSKASALWPVFGTIVTEIEALQQLADVHVVQVGAGGVAGAEGSVRLQIDGDKDEIERVEALLEGIWGEPAFC